MSTELITKTYVFGAFEMADIRIAVIDGAPWFVAADVRSIVGVQQNGNNFRFLNDDERRIVPRGLITGKGMSQATLLSEFGLYKFVLRSDKAEAKSFQDWVTREALPAIRKDGGYILGEEKVRSGEITEDKLVFLARAAIAVLKSAGQVASGSGVRPRLAGHLVGPCSRRPGSPPRRLSPRS